MTDAAVAQLRLMQLVSPALPVGAYAYSHALEHAVATGTIHDEASAGAWILGVAEHAIAPLEIPVFARVHAALATEDYAAAQRWNALLCAARETRELALEDAHMAKALWRLLGDLGVAQLHATQLADGDDAPAYTTLLALACLRWDIPVADAQRALLLAFCENQIAAAIKIVPLGQTAGQRLLGEAITRIPAWVDSANALPDAAIGPSAPGLAIASSLHEDQYSRLFRS